MVLLNDASSFMLLACDMKLGLFSYVSSDFGNHPLSHLMGSVFGMHDRENVEVCIVSKLIDHSYWVLVYWTRPKLSVFLGLLLRVESK